MGAEKPDIKKHYEFQGKQFEVDEPAELTADDIQIGDRVFVTTESGNRYMLRRSKSRNGALMVYNQRDQFSSGHPLHVQAKTLATIGMPFDHFFITDTEKNLGTKQSTTPVTRIEIRRGFDDVAESAQGAEGANLADMLKNKATGRETKE